MRLEDAFKFIAYELEGRGYSKHDAAGATIYGITKKYYPEYYSALLGATNKEELDKTIELVYSSIFNRTKAKYLKFPLDILYFDFAFNAGEDDAGKALQKTLNLLGAHLVVDGIVGKKTLASYENFKNIPEIPLIYNAERRLFYIDNPQKEFRKGWLNRVSKLEEFVFLGG